MAVTCPLSAFGFQNGKHMSFERFFEDLDLDAREFDGNLTSRTEVPV